MPEPDDIGLLTEYARHNSEEAFTALVERHVNLVYSVALRSVGHSDAAEEIAQAVFIILAQKAQGLSKRTVLSGWLYQTTRLTAANYLRTEIRRQKREQEAYMQSILNEADGGAGFQPAQTWQAGNLPHYNDWEQIAPLLDDALERLGEKDRNAIVLRFFENKNLREVGAVLGASEGAAKMRVNRALDKLRNFFAKRGVNSTLAIIAGVISSNSVQAAPAGLAKAITGVALVKGTAVSTSTLTLVKGALKLMAWTKAKTAGVVGAGILLAAGTTTITVKEIQEHRTYPWQIPGFDSRVLDQQPPQVEILPSSVPYPAWGTTSDGAGHTKLMGTGVTAENIVLTAYGFWTSARTILTAELPQGKYDYIASLPSGNEAALQQEIQKKFGVVAGRETRNTDVLLLEVRNPNALRLKPSRGRNPQDGASFNSSRGEWSFTNAHLSMLVGSFENYLGTPVADQTGLTDKFDIDLKFNDSQHPDLQNLRQALLDQLDLELVPTNMPIEMLVVEKVN